MGKVELNVGVDTELADQAKRLGVDIAGMSEAEVRLRLQKIDPAGGETRARRWADENAEGIEAHNARIPLVNDAHRTVDVLEVEVSVGRETLVLVVSELFSLSAKRLGRRVGSIIEHEDAIRRGLDRLFTGF